jgi:multicomponent Na+:H+ antiporter subunit G
MSGVDLVRFGLGGALSFAACMVVLGVALALVRFPDVFARIHAAALIPALAGPLACAGLALVAWDGAMTARLALLAGVLAVLGPAAAHLLAAAAHGAGLTPGGAVAGETDSAL